LPGIKVQLAAVRNCNELAKQSDPRMEASTNANGLASLNVTENQSYALEVGGEGGFERQRQCVRLGSLPAESPTAYVQIRLRLDLRFQVTLSEPAANPTGPTSVTLTDFVGAYVGSAGEFYEVELLEDGGGIELTLPDGRGLAFPSRRGTRFSGPNGVLSFQTAKKKVIGISFTPAAVIAKRPN
jgi:hypothetical protein